MEYLEVDRLYKTFAKFVAVDNVSFSVPKGGFVTLLGPSGCGKTTTLRCIAGLTAPDGGDIFLDGSCISSYEKQIMLPPEKRILGMVFQSYAIWPHLNVFANIAYPLKARKFPKEGISKRVEECMKMVGLTGLGNRFPEKLSGGQQQRVALARALVSNPRLLLFDEPLSNLDAKLRERTRLELKKLQQEIGITAVYVTHDQVEAMTISQIVIVMNQGKIIQTGSPWEIYRKPVNDFVADFIGVTNLMDAEVLSTGEAENRCGKVRLLPEYGGGDLFAYIPPGIAPGERVTVCIRPENLEVSSEWKERDNCLWGEISDFIYLGNLGDVRVKLGERQIRAQVPWDFAPKAGAKVRLKTKPEHCLILKECKTS